MTNLQSSQLVSEWIKIHWHIDITKIFFIHTGTIIDLFAFLFELILITFMVIYIIDWIYNKITSNRMSKNDKSK
jgi:hypothetical protein